MVSDWAASRQDVPIWIWDCRTISPNSDRTLSANDAAPTRRQSEKVGTFSFQVIEFVPLIEILNPFNEIKL